MAGGHSLSESRRMRRGASLLEMKPRRKSAGFRNHIASQQQRPAAAAAAAASAATVICAPKRPERQPELNLSWRFQRTTATFSPKQAHHRSDSTTTMPTAGMMVGGPVWTQQSRNRLCVIVTTGWLHSGTHQGEGVSNNTGKLLRVEPMDRNGSNDRGKT